MRDDRVEMVFHRPVERLVLTDAREFKPKGKWFVWLQKALWWGLNRFGALECYFDSVTDYKRISFSKRDALHKIFEAREHLFYSNRKPNRVLIGGEDFAEIIDSETSRDCLPWGHGAIKFEGPMGFNREIYGLKVEVIPHMKGMVVL